MRPLHSRSEVARRESGHDADQVVPGDGHHVCGQNPEILGLDECHRRYNRSLAIHVALGDSCGNACTPTGNNFPVGAILRNGLHGTLTFHDSIGKGHEASLRNKYVWLFVKAGFTPGSVTYFTPPSTAATR